MRGMLGVEDPVLPPRPGSIRQIMGKLPFLVSSDSLEFVPTPLLNLRFEELLN